MELFTNIFEKVWGNREDELVKAMQKTNNGGNVDDVDTIVDDYVYLIKKTIKSVVITILDGRFLFWQSLLKKHFLCYIIFIYQHGESPLRITGF